MRLMRREKQAKRRILVHAVHKLKSVTVERVCLIAIPAFVPPAVKIHRPIEIIGMKIIAAPMLKTEPVAAFRHVVPAADFRKRTRVQMPLANPRRPVTIAAEHVPDADFIMPGFHEINQMPCRLWMPARQQHRTVRRADRHRRNRIGKDGALLSQPVNVRCLNLFFAVDRERTRPHLVCQ